MVMYSDGGWGDQRNMGKNTHVSLHPELPLYTRELVLLWEVGEKEESLPCSLKSRLWFLQKLA